MEILIVIFILLFSVILHEAMHGVVAEKLGDPTARLMGRLTLNPIPHIDPVASILIPALLIFTGSPILFGAAKPVPVNPLYLREGRKDLALVALSGPATNIILAVIASAVFKLLPLDLLGIKYVLLEMARLNIALAVVNLIPIPPLDGSKVFSIILPDDLARSYFAIEPFGIFILFFLLLSPIGGFSLARIINDLILFSLRLLGI